MITLREELDGEIVPPRFSDEPSECNPHPIDCSACGRTVYTDKPSFESYVRSLNYEPTNQFICDDCSDAAAEEHR